MFERSLSFSVLRGTLPVNVNLTFLRSFTEHFVFIKEICTYTLYMHLSVINLHILAILEIIERDIFSTLNSYWAKNALICPKMGMDRQKLKKIKRGPRRCTCNPKKTSMRVHFIMLDSLG